MSEKPICRSINFPVYKEMLDRYEDSADLKESYEKNGLNGLEIIRVGESEQEMIRPDMINGVHLYYHIFWMDWWRGEYARMDEEFDGRDQWLDYYGGTDREAYLSVLRKDLEYAEAMGAKYVVFHVSEVTLRESFLYEYKYTDEEVIESSLEIINTLLDEREYSFDFLIENLWWSGLTMKNPSMTWKLIEEIHSEKKGIMLDLGHYMNTNCELHTEEEAVSYIHAMLDAHEKAGLLQWIKGIHIQMSLSGEYVKEQKKEWEENPMDFEKIPFYELFRLFYAHVHDIDQHRPFLHEGIRRILERIGPKYVTYEFHQSSREEYEKLVEKQSRVLGYIQTHLEEK